MSPVELLELADDESELAEDESELVEDGSELIEEILETILLSLLRLVLLDASVDAGLDELLIELVDELLDALIADPAPQPTNKQAHRPAEIMDPDFINVPIANSIKIIFLPSPILPLQMNVIPHRLKAAMQILKNLPEVTSCA